MSNTKQRSSLDQDNINEISGFIKYLQAWDFFGLKFCIVYTIVDTHATQLQGDKVNIYVAIFMVKNISMELIQQRDNFDEFWDEVLEERVTINKLAKENETITDYDYYDEIEEPTCPRVLKITFFLRCK